MGSAQLLARTQTRKQLQERKSDPSSSSCSFLRYTPASVAGAKDLQGSAEYTFEFVISLLRAWQQEWEVSA